MPALATLPEVNSEQLVKQILTSHKLTRSDQHLLNAVFSKSSLSVQEEKLRSRVHDALRNGLLRVLD